MEPQFTPHTTEPTVTETSTSLAVVPKKTSRVRIALVLGILVGAALVYLYFAYVATPVAAVVNGTKITVENVNADVELMKKSAELQGIDVTDTVVLEEINRQALENLINNALLIEAARASGMTANEASVQSAYETLVTEIGGEELLKTRMETIGLTNDTLMSNISDRLVVDEYIESVTDIETLTVSPEEVAAYIASINTEGVTLPPLEELAPQIESTLLAEKQQGIVDELLTKLRNEATIEIR